MNPVYTHSGVSTVKTSTLLIAQNAPTENIDLIENGIPKNPKSSEKSGLIQFAQLWEVEVYEY